MEKGQKKYTIKEVSKKLKVSVGKLKEWEESFSHALYVQRTKTGARLYSDFEIETLKKIKILKDHHINDDHVNFILDTNYEVERDDDISETTSPEMVDMLVSLQNDTTETIQQLNESFAQVKEEIILDLKEEIKTELNAGHHKTKSLIQSYSHLVVDRAEHTQEEITKLRQDIHREEEEKLFIQHKLEEREEQFQEFVLAYRQSAAAKQRFPNWLKIFKMKKEGSMDLN
ncbi:MerR family transcriptional regulator [Halalkalibacter alkalisediminis]|uniref:MerR family transcriptional regulator n=1 Tax=Halalkalibacter alkalisediminis TaxID=935616 RepID=A0ABV6NND6_9BACI|nr:MerR family transcriptional regulator [Halalkalibacter alkalisediminis]